MVVEIKIPIKNQHNLDAIIGLKGFLNIDVVSVDSDIIFEMNNLGKIRVIIFSILYAKYFIHCNIFLNI